LALTGASLASLDAGATTDATPVRPREAQLTLIGRFGFPVHVASPPGVSTRLFVVEKEGRILLLENGRKLDTPFLDISAEVAPGNEPGLLSMAFSPGYARNRLFYVYYAGTDRRTHLLEFRESTSNPNRADPASRRQVLSFEHPSGEHFGGLLLFGPNGKLYLGTGDGGLTEGQDKMRAQRLNDPNGKILRVNPTTGATRVVARGLRNPWRYTIDRKTGDLYVGDVGEFVRESIKFAPAAKIQGTNFGWPCFEGTLPSTQFSPAMCPGRIPPLYEYAREGGNCSVVGGVVVSDPRLPLLVGRFLYTDYCLGEVIVLNVRNGQLASKRSLRIYQSGTTSFGTDALQRIYITTAAGSVYRLDPRTRTGTSATKRASTGKEVFLAAGCGTCHILAAAKTGGTYGPNLDITKPTRALVIERVTFGKGAMPWFKGRLSDQQIQAISDFISKR
jgi:glucose/arabinose dehydrogenase/cytochrome c553